MEQSQPMETAGVVKAASTGFTLLLLGELVVLGFRRATGVSGPLLPLASALAYTVTGLRAVLATARCEVRSLRPEAAGALAAVGAYALTVPLRFLVNANPGALSTVTNFVFAAAVGAVAGRIGGAAIPPNGGS